MTQPSETDSDHRFFEPTQGAVWKFVATSAVSLLVGIAIPWVMVGKDIITRQDLSDAFVPMQQQLTTIIANNAKDEEKIEQLEIQVGELNERIGIEGRSK